MFNPSVQFDKAALLLLILLLFQTHTGIRIAAAETNQRSKDSVSASLRHFNSSVLEDTQPFKEGYLTVDGQRMHYVTGGSGKLIVFYHGFPSYWYQWKHQLKALSAHYRVVAIDALGANLSAKPQEVDAYHIAKLEQQLSKMIQNLAGQQPYVLVGHDWGGALAWAHAQKNPSGLEKLIVLNAPPYNLFLDLLQSNPEQQETSKYMYRLISEGSDKKLAQNDALLIWELGGYPSFAQRGLLSETESGLFRQALARQGAVTGGINWYRANVPPHNQISDQHFWPSRTSSTAVDSMLIWGSADRTFISKFIDLLPEYTNRLRVETLQGIGHSPHLESPDEVNRLIREFIESNGPSPTHAD